MHNPVMHRIVSAIKDVTVANSTVSVVPFSLNELFYPFENDYYMYSGSLTTNKNESNSYMLLWLISRDVINISFEQVTSI